MGLTIKIVAGLAVLSVSACATAPRKIQAQYISPLVYQDYDCDQIGLEQARIERRTGELYSSLKSEANADAWQMGIGLVLFWPALFFLEGGDGPEATEYSRLRGEYDALSEVSVMKKCQLDFHEDLSEFVKSENQDDAVESAEGADEVTEEAAAEPSG